MSSARMTMMFGRGAAEGFPEAEGAVKTATPKVRRIKSRTSRHGCMTHCHPEAGPGDKPRCGIERPCRRGFRRRFQLVLSRRIPDAPQGTLGPGHLPEAWGPSHPAWSSTKPIRRNPEVSSDSRGPAPSSSSTRSEATLTPFGPGRSVESAQAQEEGPEQPLTEGPLPGRQSSHRESAGGALERSGRTARFGHS
jgi:hypothetical protein